MSKKRGFSDIRGIALMKDKVVFVLEHPTVGSKIIREFAIVFVIDKILRKKNRQKSTEFHLNITKYSHGHQ